jgi:hypothetical protein
MSMLLLFSGNLVPMDAQQWSAFCSGGTRSVVIGSDALGSQ